jgi:uncharacterized membrane protein (DUF106 family)
VDGVLEILLMSVGFSLLSALINRKFGNRKRVNEIQREMKEYQRELKEATDKRDEAALKRLKARESQVMEMTKEMLFLPFKSMIIILPLFFIVLWALGAAFPSFSVQLPVALHWNELFSLKILSPSAYGVRGYFIVVAVFSGLVIELVIQAYDKMKAKEAKVAKVK